MFEDYLTVIVFVVREGSLSLVKVCEQHYRTGRDSDESERGKWLNMIDFLR